MTNTYASSPIKEALCEFQFVPSQTWDMLLLGQLYAKFRDEFPTKREHLGFKADLQYKEGSTGTIEMAHHIQFSSPTRPLLIQVSPDVLAFNHLAPYSSWHDFKSTITKNLTTYLQTLDPSGFKQIQLRYINEIKFEKPRIKVKEYLNYYPHMPTDVPRTVDAYDIKVEIPFEEGRDKLIMTSKAFNPEGDIHFLLLDLDYTMTRSGGIELDQASMWLEDAHTNIKNYFKSCITDKCAGLLGAEDANDV